MKNYQRSVLAAGLVCLLLSSPRATALILSSEGNLPVQDFGWPEGTLALANLKTRIGYWEGPPFGGGEYHFIYRGDDEAFKLALTKFAAIRAPALEVIVHDGPGHDQFVGKGAPVDWTFTVWVPKNWENLYNNPKSTFNTNDPDYGKPLPPPRMVVYVGAGGLDWEKITAPPNVQVLDERSSVAKHGVNPPLNEENGLYFISPTNTGRSATNDQGETVWAGKKTGIEVITAHVYSQDNANSTFQVALSTSDFTVDPLTLALFVGGRAYVPNGWASTGGHTNSMGFIIHGESEARAVAKSLSMDCVLRSNPGYKYLAQFIPTQKEFQTNGPVIVKLEIKNLDDRAFSFQRGGEQRGARDNQYGFRAILDGMKPVADTGDPENFGGPWMLQTIEPGKTFEDKVDLRRWFAFDKSGNYYIHGFYELAFYAPAKNGESTMPWNILWSDYASADFEVVIK